MGLNICIRVCMTYVFFCFHVVFVLFSRCFRSQISHFYAFWQDFCLFCKNFVAPLWLVVDFVLFLACLKGKILENLAILENSLMNSVQALAFLLITSFLQENLLFLSD
jgi:hypothetical protein